MMRLAGTLLSYVAAISVLCAGLIGGVMWLIQTGPGISHEARVAPIAPRIAESIERKKPFPVQVSEPAPAKPAMTEAKASLTPAPVRSLQIRELTPPPRHKRKPRGETAIAQQMPGATAPSAAVSTARTDFPY